MALAVIVAQPVSVAVWTIVQGTVQHVVMHVPAVVIVRATQDVTVK